MLTQTMPLCAFAFLTGVRKVTPLYPVFWIRTGFLMRIWIRIQGAKQMRIRTSLDVGNRSKDVPTIYEGTVQKPLDKTGNQVYFFNFDKFSCSWIRIRIPITDPQHCPYPLPLAGWLWNKQLFRQILGTVPYSNFGGSITFPQKLPNCWSLDNFRKGNRFS